MKNRNSKAKSPWMALLISVCILPGGGQIYNGQKAKGYLIAIIFFVSLNLALVEMAWRFIAYWKSLAFDPAAEIPTYSQSLLAGINNPRIWIELIIALLFYLYALADAYIISRRNQAAFQSASPSSKEPDHRAR